MMDNQREYLIAELISSGVLKTPRIIDAFRAIDRKDFVPPASVDAAYEDRPLPIGYGQTISQPFTVAFMLELLQPAPGQKILDVGHGSGWQTALLAEVVGKEGKIVAVERIPELCVMGKQNLEKYEFAEKGTAALYCKDATRGIPEETPFDKIIAAAAAAKEIPAAWKTQLKVGGMIVAPIGGSIWRFWKKSETEWKEEEFRGFSFVPLIKDAPSPAPVPQQKRQTPTAPRALFSRTPWFPVLLLFISGFVSYVLYETFAPLPLPEKNTQVVIAANLGVRGIAALLAEKHVIRSPWLFIGWTALSGNAKRLQAGSYQFEGAVTIPGVAARLISGEEFPNERLIIIPEGWNLNDIAGYLESQRIAARADFFSVTGRPHAYTPAGPAQQAFREKFSILRDLPQGISLEGYLFPDTYRIFRDATAEDVVGKMIDTMEKKLTPGLLAEMRRQKKTVHAVLTVASLVEKEVTSDADRAIVAGIIWKRLSLGMGLQVDASVAYLADTKPSAITKNELSIDSPYNTYKYGGLPPGPIANPGLSAIRAALFPAASPYLYYLSAPDGKTIFSKTIEEHNAAKAAYLR